MTNAFVAVNVDGPGVDRIVTPEAVKYVFDLNREDAQNQGLDTDPANLDEVNRDELITLYNAVVEDGRYIRMLGTDPEQVAADLGLNLSQENADRIRIVGGFAGSNIVDFPAGIDPNVAWVTVVAVAVIVIVAAVPDETIIDTSGLMKL